MWRRYATPGRPSSERAVSAVYIPATVPPGPSSAPTPCSITLVCHTSPIFWANFKEPVSRSK
jgi:hypothetical protein